MGAEKITSSCAGYPLSHAGAASVSRSLYARQVPPNFVPFAAKKALHGSFATLVARHCACADLPNPLPEPFYESQPFSVAHLSNFDFESGVAVVDVVNPIRFIGIE